MPATTTIPKKSAKQRREIPRERENAWLRAHAREYPGCWIALTADHLIAADPNLEVVLTAVEQVQWEKRPLLYYQAKPIE